MIGPLMARLADEEGDTLQSAEAREGIAASRARRKPSWYAGA